MLHRFGAYALLHRPRLLCVPCRAHLPGDKNPPQARQREPLAGRLRMHNLTEQSRTYQIDQHHPEGPDTHPGAIGISHALPCEDIPDMAA